jgi:hypothetical protein
LIDKNTRKKPYSNPWYQSTWPHPQSKNKQTNSR